MLIVKYVLSSSAMKPNWYIVGDVKVHPGISRRLFSLILTMPTIARFCTNNVSSNWYQVLQEKVIDNVIVSRVY